MKKLKLLLVGLIAIVLLPLTIGAQSNEKITVHIFRGEGCGYCAAALSFFEGLEDEYGQYYELEEHEVWYDEDNANLMSNVAAYFNEEVSGVPYIIIGDKTFQGYTESYNDEIKKAIKEAYESGNFEDRVKQVQSGNTTTSNKSDDSNATTIIIIAVALVGFVALFYFARDNQVEEGEVEKEEKVVETIVEEEKKSPAKKTTTKKAPAKKSSTTKTTTKKTQTTKKAPAKTTASTKKSSSKTTKKSGK